jgi:hypothetical protein
VVKFLRPTLRPTGTVIIAARVWIFRRKSADIPHSPTLYHHQPISIPHRLRSIANITTARKQHQMHQTSSKSGFERARFTTNGNINRIARRKRVARTKDPAAEDWIG